MLSSDAVGAITSVAAVFYGEEGTMSERMPVVGTNGATSKAGGAHPQRTDRTSTKELLLAEVEAHAARALDAVRHSTLNARKRQALELVAEGKLSYAEIAQRTGYRSRGPIYRSARAYGLLSLHSMRRGLRPEALAEEDRASERRELQRRDGALWEALMDFLGLAVTSEGPAPAQESSSKASSFNFADSPPTPAPYPGAR